MPPWTPWTQYAVGDPNANNWTCLQFELVDHVTHLRAASRIVEDGKIQAGLVFDASRLNQSRVLVNWLSPNDWTRADGFRYGNIRFRYPFKSLIEGMRFYWVEVMTIYKPRALRILISDRDYSSTLDEYDPTQGDGPWWHDAVNDTHYFNGKYCLELMLERTLPLSECVTVDTVKHHPSRCNIAWQTCSDRGLTAADAERLFFAKALAEGGDLSHLPVTKTDGGNREAGWSLLNGILFAFRRATKGVAFNGPVYGSASVAKQIVRAAMHAVANREDDAAKELSALFQSKSDFEQALDVLSCTTFGLDSPPLESS